MTYQQAEMFESLFDEAFTNAPRGAIQLKAREVFEPLLKKIAEYNKERVELFKEAGAVEERIGESIRYSLNPLPDELKAKLEEMGGLELPIEKTLSVKDACELVDNKKVNVLQALGIVEQ